MIRCQSALSLCLLCLCYFFFKRTMRVAVYLSLAFMKEEDQTGDRQISFSSYSFFLSLSLFLLCSLNASRCSLKRNKNRVLYSCLPISFSSFSPLTIICPKIAQCDRFSANHWRRPIANFSVSLSLLLLRSKDIQTFSRLLVLTGCKNRTHDSEEDERE